MKNLTSATCLILFMLSAVSCGNTTTQSVSIVSSTPFVVDSTLQIKNIQDLRIIENSLYLTYDYVGGYGHQMLCTYDIDYNNTGLKFCKTFFREENNYYSIFAPVSFWDNNGNMYVVERDQPNINIVSNDTMHRTPKALISSNAQTPYEMVLEAKQAFYKSPDEYYFIGRQPMSGIQAIYLSDNHNSRPIVTEIRKLIFDERYPSWILNHGKFSYNHKNKMGVYAFQMFPAIHIYDFINSKDKTVVVAIESFDYTTISEADVWEANPIQFKDISTTDNYIYALYWGFKASDMDKKHSDGTAKTKVVKCDWEGNILETYVINKRLQAFCVSDDDKRIIAYDGNDFLLINL